MDIIKKHREWLKDYEGLKYGMGVEGHYKKGFQWTKTKYQDALWSTEINLVGEKKDKLRIEFDDDNAKENLEKVKKKLIEMGYSFIRSTHKGKCDYLWVEFTRNLTSKEKEAFLKWIAPKGSEIDLNFASHRRIFPVMYAIHWKHSYEREMPIESNIGNKIDFDSLIKDTKTSGVEDFKYRTYSKPEIIFTRKIQASEFNRRQPIFYDKAGLWWMWNRNELFWEITDEIDILNMINEAMGIEIIKSQERNEIVNALKQVGRTHAPKPIKPTWIQFKTEIFDIKTGETLIPTPEYFVTNPIPYALHQNKYMNTPVMDKIFEEWVGKKYVQTLYEIIAYCLLPSYPLNRLFCFIGAGMNGKTKFLELLCKFVGEHNCTSTELDTLLTSRFEVTRLHKKLVCQMGETNFNEISRTSILKKLTGGDLIGFEYKNKNPFHDKNYAKILISTNNLPTTTDKTIGFYRRWLILDFPNQFSEQKNILEDIPEEEYECLALKSCFVLKELLDVKGFHEEGDIEARIEKYEAKADFLQKFLKDFTCEDPDEYITKAEFYRKFCDWCRENRHRKMSETSVGLKMKEKNIESGRKYFDWLYDGKGGTARIWESIKWKE